MTVTSLTRTEAKELRAQIDDAIDAMRSEAISLMRESDGHAPLVHAALGNLVASCDDVREALGDEQLGQSFPEPLL